MLSERIFISTFAGVGVLIGVLHITALEYYLYWQLPWFDVLLHFLGGLFTGLAVVAFYVHWFGAIEIDHRRLFWSVMVGVLAVGVSWEFFEMYAGLTFVGQFGFWSDTISDIILDLSGAFLAYHISQRFQTLRLQTVS